MRSTFVFWRGLIAGAGVGTIGAIFFPFSQKEETPVKENELQDISGTINETQVIYNQREIPTSKWIYDWDYREARCAIKTPNDNKIEKKDKEANKHVCGTRHIFLIRHGEYVYSSKSDQFQHLTERGRKQAKLTGQRLRDLGFHWDRCIVSTMTRARETADIICEEIKFDKAKAEYTDLLREGIPFMPEPRTEWKPPHKIHRESARIEAGFREYMHRADPDSPRLSCTLIIAHANVIRYFVCRVLQFPADGWLRLALNHASITWISIKPDGCVKVRCLGDTGHMPVSMITHRLQSHR